MSLTYKVYREDNDETRRFRLEESICSSFLAVNQKIESVFEIPKHMTFKVCWKDEEDMVTISSDEELLDAISNRKNDLLKLFIRVTTATSHPSRTDSDLEQAEGLGSSSRAHRGIFCDACKQPIEGNRFKCILCHDFDLCQTCFIENRHPSHDMLVVRSPDSLPNQLLAMFTLRLSDIYRRFQHKKQRQEQNTATDSGEKNPKKDKKSGDCEGFTTDDCQFGAMHPWAAWAGAANTTGRHPPHPPMWGGPTGWFRGGRGRCWGLGRGRSGRGCGFLGNFPLPPWMMFGADSAAAGAPIVLDSDEENCSSGDGQPSSSGTSQSQKDTRTSQSGPTTAAPSITTPTPMKVDDQVTTSPTSPVGSTCTGTESTENSSVLKVMQSMGFNNENGWLARLLAENGNDINATLTAIQMLAKSSGYQQ